MMNTRRSFLKTMGLGAAAVALPDGAKAKRAGLGPTVLSSPKNSGTNLNVLVITVDTLRWDHVGYNKQPVGWIKEKKKRIITPNIDRLARRAAIFDRHYIGSFPTVPQRTDCFTGNVNFPRYDWKKLGDDEIILSQLLHEAGYYCGLVSDTGSMFNANFTRGFDDAVKTIRPPADRPDPSEIPMPAPKENYRQNGGQRNRQLSEQAHFEHESDWWVAQTMAEAAEWIKVNGQRDKWFLWIDTFEVHEVWNPPQKYIDLYDPHFDAGIDYDFPNYAYTDIYTDAELHHLWARYAGEVTLTDHWIGRVLDQLDAQNLWDRTIVVLQSDHGMYIGEHNRTGKHTVQHDDPWPLYEEVALVPHLVWAPLKGLPRHVSALTQQADLMPTVLAATGVKGPETHGRSYLHLMTGEKRPCWDVVYSSWHNPPSKKKFTTGRLTATTDRWALVAHEQDRPAELYDLKNDPRQRRNVVARYPDISKSIQNGVIEFMREQKAEQDYVNKFL